jgi:hypothetical protein
LLDPQMTSERLIAAANVPKVIDLERAPHPRNSGGPPVSSAPTTCPDARIASPGSERYFAN